MKVKQTLVFIYKTCKYKNVNFLHANRYSLVFMKRKECKTNICVSLIIFVDCCLMSFYIHDENKENWS